MERNMSNPYSIEEYDDFEMTAGRAVEVIMDYCFRCGGDADAFNVSKAIKEINRL